MTIAYWCVLVIILFPYVFTVLAKFSRSFNNYDPRGYLEKLTGWRKRAHYVQLNSFEMMAPFGVSVVIAHLVHAAQHTIDSLSITFVLSRVMYALCYLLNFAALRTIFWVFGLVCIIGFYVIAS